MRGLLVLLALACAPTPTPASPPEPVTLLDLAEAVAERQQLRLEIDAPERLRAVPIPSLDADDLQPRVEAAGLALERGDGVLRIGEPRATLRVDEPALAVALGDCRRALDLLETATEPAEHLAAAHCALALQRPAEALTRLDEVTGPLQPWAAWLRGVALRDLGRTDNAAAALDGVQLPGEHGLRLRLERARLRGDRAALAKLADTEVGREARLHLAELLEGAARREALLALWTDGVSPYDARAAELLAADGADVPDLTTPSGRAAAATRVAALRRGYRVEEALALLEQLHEATPPSSPAEHLTLARARLSARSYAASKESWSAALGPPDEARGRPADLFDYALTIARSGDYDTAAVVYRRVMAQHPGTPQADFASFKLGYMEYDRNDCAAAVPLLQAHQAALPGSKHLDEALWFESRCHWRGGALDETARTLKALIAARPKSSLAPGAHYWLARIEGRQGSAEAETAGLEAVLQRFPDSGYAWFAAERLGRRFPAQPDAEIPPWPASLASDPRVVRADLLIDVGLLPFARAELAPITATGRDAQLALAWARIRAGDYRGGQRLARPHCGPSWKGGDPVAMQACFPRPERGVVAAVVALHPLDPLLPFGIMSAESALDPSVSSPAGARGLMQLMPEVASGLHPSVLGRGAEVTPFDPDLLFQGPYNAALGTWELGERARSLDGVLTSSDLPAVAASYNGGEEAVRRWLTAYDTPPDGDIFAEDVGYVETRRYVKRVLGFVMSWRYVYGDRT